MKLFSTSMRDRKNFSRIYCQEIQTGLLQLDYIFWLNSFDVKMNCLFVVLIDTLVGSVSFSAQ